MCPENAQCVSVAQVKSEPIQAALLSNGSKDFREVLLWEYVFIQKIFWHAQMMKRSTERDDSLMKLQWKSHHVAVIQQNNYLPLRDRRCLISSIIG